MEQDELHPSSLNEAIAREELIRVEQVLGKNAFETTQLVYVVSSSGAELGPFVRKLINKQIGLGSAYAEIYKAQQKGLTSPTLPRIYALIENSTLLSVLLEYIEGKTLAEAIADCSTFAERLDLTTHYFPDICKAVTELHTCFEVPIIHRDLKPSNIMLRQNSIKLLDFGIARIFKQEAESDTKHFGTRPYAPPEQYGFGQTDVRSDVYALGKVLLFCLTGEEPAADVANALTKHPEIPLSLQAVVAYATKLDPAARPQSAEALKNEFERAAQKSKVPAKEPLRALGIIWDVVLAICAIFTIAGSWLAFTNPTPENQGLPSWYLFYSLFFWAAPIAIIILYLISDRRPLRKIVPRLATHSIKSEVIRSIIAIGMLTLIWTALTLAILPA